MSERDALDKRLSQHAEATAALRKAISDAGIPNPYWPPYPDYDDVRTPWLRVFTSRGVIVFGRRKRVFSIDWYDSVFAASGDAVVAEDWITHDETMCHAYGLEQATECLRRLWDGGVRHG